MKFELIIRLSGGTSTSPASGWNQKGNKYRAMQQGEQDNWSARWCRNKKHILWLELTTRIILTSCVFYCFRSQLAHQFLHGMQLSFVAKRNFELIRRESIIYPVTFMFRKCNLQFNEVCSPDLASNNALLTLSHRPTGVACSRYSVFIDKILMLSK